MKSGLTVYYRGLWYLHTFRKNCIAYTVFSLEQEGIDPSRSLRQTAAKYLDALADGGFLRKERMGSSNFYINQPLFRLFQGQS